MPTDISGHWFKNFPNGGKRWRRKGTSIDDSTPNRIFHTHLHGPECGERQNQTGSRSISLGDHTGGSDASSRRPPLNSPGCVGPIVCALPLWTMEHVLLIKQIHARAADLKRKVGTKELKSPISALHTPSTPPRILQTPVVDSDRTRQIGAINQRV